ncbi:MAG: XisI protein [Coleofasciculaceae cyanobacterium RL_1_1]|nr:XisI protein [Coleofasciculaceae cyanobacterium RL_1_1]
MDRLVTYRNAIKQLLSEYHSGERLGATYESQLIFDEVRDHYLWLDLGWEGSRRVYHSIMHFDIKDERIWIQENMTDRDPAEDLIALGVERQDIVLGLQPPFKRPFTNYGVA